MHFHYFNDVKDRTHRGRCVGGGWGGGGLGGGSDAIGCPSQPTNRMYLTYVFDMLLLTILGFCPPKGLSIHPSASML